MKLTICPLSNCNYPAISREIFITKYEADVKNGIMYFKNLRTLGICQWEKIKCLKGHICRVK